MTITFGGQWQQTALAVRRIFVYEIYDLHSALMLFALQGDSAEARKAKKTMHQTNKHTIKYLTGQKTVKQPSEFYRPGQASEAEMYIKQYAKEARRSVPGALF